MHFAVRIFVFSLCVSAAAYAGDLRAQEAVMFPPNAATCVPGQKNLLMWDGQNNVTCLPIPVCPGPEQILTFDGVTVTCYPQPPGGAPTAVPAIPGGVPVGP
ncbi:MAG: hypothetical protein AB7H77_05290 [Bdellovibrionales bacterium]